MQRFRLAALFLVLALTFVPTVFVLAQGNLNSSSGLVPCGAGTGDAATNCEACHLVSLIQNIIMFLIGLSIPVAVAMFAYAGILYFSSGVGGSEYISRAKKIFSSAFVGFALAVGAWVIVNTILYTILDHNKYPNSSWFRIDCSVGRVVVDPGGISGVIQGTLGVVPTPTTPTGAFQDPSIWGGGSTYTCPPGFELQPNATCLSTTDNTTTAAPTIVQNPIASVGGGTLSQEKLEGQLAGTYQYRSQLASICAAQGLSDCRLAQAIMAIESGGRSLTSPAGAQGLMQLMPGTARGLDSSLSGLSDAQIVNRLKSDSTLNMTLGVKYLAQLQNTFNTLPQVIAAYNGGPGANSPSRTCAGQTYWECTANEGYAETRNYVPNVINAMNVIR